MLRWGSARFLSDLRMRITQCSTAPQIEQLILSSNPSQFDSISSALAVSRLAKTSSRNRQAVHKIVSVMEGKMFNGHSLGAICHGIAKGRLLPEFPAFIQTQVKHVELSRCPDQALSNMLWSFARLNFRPEGLLDRFSTEMESRDATKLDPQVLSLALWSFASLGHPISPQFLSQLGEVKFSDFKSQDVSSTLWALATTDAKAPKLVSSLVSRVKHPGALREYANQSLCLTYWAAARLDVRDAELYTALRDEILRRDTTTFNDKDLGNIVWAMGKSESASPQVLFKISNEVQLNRLSEKGFISLLHGFALCSFYLPCEALCRELKTRDLARFSSFGLSGTMHSLEVMLHDDVELLGLLARQMTPRRLEGEFTYLDLSVSLLSFARFGFGPKETVENIAHEVCRRSFTSFSSQAVVNVLWSFACLDVLHLPVVKRVFHLSPGKDAPPSGLVEHRHQLAQIDFAWKLTNSSEGGSSPPILVALQAGIPGGSLPLQPVSNPSNVQRRVQELLATQFDIESEVRNEVGLTMDILIPSLGAVVEVDGPNHFYRNTGAKTGRGVFRTRLLNGLGLEVYSVYTDDFRKMSPENQTLEIENLAERIKTERAEYKPVKN